MKRLEQQHTLDDQRTFSSIWAIPDTYNRQMAVILAHGAGNDMHHPFMCFFHERLAAEGILTVKFNFPYKEQGRKAPDRMPVLLAAWREIVRSVMTHPELAPQHLFLGGKSMGGRAASMLVAEGQSCRGLIFLGYPLHPPGKPDKPRSEHLFRIPCPMLFIQGTRDRLCGLKQLGPILDRLAAPVTLHVVEDGDHSFKVPKRTGRSEEEIREEIAGVMIRWIHDHSKSD